MGDPVRGWQDIGKCRNTADHDVHHTIAAGSGIFFLNWNVEIGILYIALHPIYFIGQTKKIGCCDRNGIQAHLLQC